VGAKGWRERYATVVGDTTWQESAACRGSLQLFFDDDTAQAKSVCRGCTVRAKCLDFALANDCRAGVWGGLDADERRALKRRSRT